jgi:tetratricopeptide (TPR) repeat protein
MRGLALVLLFAGAQAMVHGDARADTHGDNRSTSSPTEASRREALRLRNLGAEALERGDTTRALELFERAYTLVPSANLRFNLGVVYTLLGRSPEAIDAFHAFLAGVPNAPREARLFAQAKLAELERPSAAPNSQTETTGLPELERGERLFRAQQYAEALEAFSAGYARTHRAAFLLNIARCQQQLGDTDKARDAYRAFIEGDPASPDAADAKLLLQALHSERVANEPHHSASEVSNRYAPKIGAGLLMGLGLGALAVGSGLLGNYGAAYAKRNVDIDHFQTSNNLDGERIGGAITLAIGASIAVSGLIVYLTKARSSRSARHAHARGSWGAFQ